METNNKRQIIFTVLAIVLGVGLVFAIALFFKSEAPEEQVQIKGDVVSFIADRPEFVIRGNNLSEVKIYGVESPDDITHTLLATAQMTDTVGGVDVWKASIPTEPIVLSQIYIDAVDTNGGRVDRFYFALSGHSDIFTALWLDNPAEVFSMQLGDEVTISGLQLEILEIVRDNRCPIGVECVTAGGVEILLKAKGEGAAEEISLATDMDDVITVEGKRISIQEVSPDAIAAQEILESDYRFILVLEQESKS